MTQPTARNTSLGRALVRRYSCCAHWLLAACCTLVGASCLFGCTEDPQTSSKAQPIRAAMPPQPVAVDGESTPVPVPPPKGVKLKPGARTVVLDKAGDRPYDKTFDDLRFDIKVGEPFKPE